jgi:hypothetical protein
MKPYVYLGGHKGLLAIGAMRVVFDTRDIGMINLVSSDAVYEPDVWLALSLLLQPGATFIDVGANVGILTARALGLVQRSGKVLAFEPNAQLFPMLRQNIVLNGGSGVAQARQVAVYDRPGLMNFSYESTSTASARSCSTAP